MQVSPRRIGAASASVLTCAAMTVGCVRSSDTHVYVKDPNRVGVVDTTRGASTTILEPDGVAGATGAFTRAQIEVQRTGDQLVLADTGRWPLVDADRKLPRTGHRTRALLQGDLVRVPAERTVSVSSTKTSWGTSYEERYVSFDIVVPRDNIDRIVEKRRPTSRAPAYLYIPLGLLATLGGLKFAGDGGALGATGYGLLGLGVPVLGVGLWYGFWPGTESTWRP